MNMRLGESGHTIEVKEQKAPKIEAQFEQLSGANMPEGVNRYRIVKKSIDGKRVSGTDIMGNFFECDAGNVTLTLGTHGSKLNDHTETKNGKNNTALVMPLPFIGSDGKTEGLTVANGSIDTSEVINYYGDNALVYFKDGKSGIIKVNIGTNAQTKERLKNPEITASNPNESTLLDQILDPNNGYTVCQ